MAVEFEKLTDAIRNMGEAVLRRQAQSAELIAALRARLDRYATAWDHIDLSLATIEKRVDEKYYRSARPLFRSEPLNRGIDPPPAPPRATLIAVDGSQRLPTRHDPFLYYLINIGIIVYEHGGQTAPETRTAPILRFPGEDLNEDISAEFTPNTVSIKRDLAEIETLAHTVWQNKLAPAPLVALLDQRLQYWPIGISDHASSGEIIGQWLKNMETIRACHGWLVGYIERPETSSVVTLLYTLDQQEPDFDLARLHRRSPVTDADVYWALLEPGQRTPVFAIVNPSENYRRFEEENQAISFFYFRPNQTRAIARVDIPTWAAQQPDVVSAVHALLVEQCRILGNYPYVLTRADEIAVVQPKDQEYLDNLIALEMQRRGIAGTITGKQQGKEFARAGKTRFAGP